MRQGYIIQCWFVFYSLVSDSQACPWTLASCFQGQRDGVSPESRAAASECQPGILPILEGCELEQPKALESSDEQLPHQSAGTELPGLIFLLLICSFESISAFGSLSGVDQKARGSERKNKQTNKKKTLGSGKSPKHCIFLSPEPSALKPPVLLPTRFPQLSSGLPSLFRNSLSEIPRLCHGSPCQWGAEDHSLPVHHLLLMPLPEPPQECLCLFLKNGKKWVERVVAVEDVSV